MASVKLNPKTILGIKENSTALEALDTTEVFDILNINNTTVGNVLTSDNLGLIGIGVDPPTRLLHVQGNVTGNTAPSTDIQFDSSQTSGGGASAVPTTMIVTGDVTGGTFAECKGIYSILTNLTTLGSYNAIDGTVGVNHNGGVGIGVNGTSQLDAADNTNTISIGVRAVSTVGASGTPGTGVGIGIQAFATDGALNINGLFGLGDTSGDNGTTNFRGYITDGADVGEVTMSVDDVNDEFLVNATDTKIDGLAIQLRDTGGASSFKIRNSSGTDVASMSSSGVITTSTVVILGSYTVATLPAQSAGSLIYVSDETGGATLAFSDGTNYRRVQDRAIVA